MKEGFNMCTRFVYRQREDVITGFNFDIDPAVWNHKVIQEHDRFYIGILRPDGLYHSYHGVNRNGNAGTLLYVHGNPAGAYRDAPNCMTIADLTEGFIRAQLSFDEVLNLLKTTIITYAPDATMQAMLSDAQGRTLAIEPGIGHREEGGRYALMTNYSLLNPESTRPYIVPGDGRYERAACLLQGYAHGFTVSDAFSVLQAVRQEEPWATRVSFVYSSRAQAVYFVQNNRFDQISVHSFA